jgi:archaellum component FlaC
MEERIKKIEKRIENIDDKLTIILNLIEMNNNDCKKMATHIDFIEETYTSLRTPMEFLKNKFNYMTGRSSSSLPIIKDK